MPDDKKKPANKSRESSLENYKEAIDGLASLDIRLTPDVSDSIRAITQQLSWPPVSSLAGDYAKDYFDLQADIQKLQKEIAAKEVEIRSEKIKSKKTGAQLEELRLLAREYQKKSQLSNLLSKVNTGAQEKLLSSDAFVSQFTDDSARESFVLSVDIRRSTEMMLKSKEPKKYAEFIATLSNKLKDIIVSNYGIYYQFTGDGLLAFFPIFYSGEDAGYLAARSAQQCHEAFQSIYHTNRSCFTTVMKDVGLGIGIDYGMIQIVQIAGDISIVGTPVVYACRMSGAMAGVTLLNQPAYEVVFDKYSAYANINETQIDVKHEGFTLAYSIHLNDKSFSTTRPEWVDED
jgi:class 3 adenylate cyclase